MCLAINFMVFKLSFEGQGGWVQSIIYVKSPTLGHKIFLKSRSQKFIENELPNPFGQNGPLRNAKKNGAA